MVIEEIRARVGADAVVEQATADGIGTAWVSNENVRPVLKYLKHDVQSPFKMLFDLTAIDERNRKNRQGQPASDFTVVYTLYSLGRNEFIRIKTPLLQSKLKLDSIADLWANANWYEREIWDMFGIDFEGHPDMRRILMPPWWEGYPLRKEHPCRATDMKPFELGEAEWERDERELKFDPGRWGLKRIEGKEYTILNLGPHHPGTHGVLRLVLMLDGEAIEEVVPDIGFHHRAKEKMGERQSWHTYIPYTDRVDYLSGVLNNMAYLNSVEQLAGIDVPARAKVIRVMMCELYRISSHLVWYGTFAQDLGALSPVFYMFTDREKLLEIAEAVCGARLHPNWFRIGGVAQDLPNGWEKMVRDFLDYMPGRLDEYDKMVMGNRIFKARTTGVGECSSEEAIEWGMTGPNLRACGVEFDVRRAMPYSGYEQFEFEVPTAARGDCYDRAVVRVEEIRQSLRIIKQCVENMPAGEYKSEHPLTTPPRKKNTMEDIETLIDHFLNVTWGPVIPAGECMRPVEMPRGMAGYYAISDGSTGAYRLRLRTPSFAHIQMVPRLARGFSVADLLSILGSIDYILSDVDR